MAKLVFHNIELKWHHNHTATLNIYSLATYTKITMKNATAK